MQNDAPFLKERGTIRFSEWWKVESTMLECRKACCSGIIVIRQSAFLLLSSFNTDLDTKCPLLAKGKHAKAD